MGIIFFQLLSTIKCVSVSFTDFRFIVHEILGSLTFSLSPHGDDPLSSSIQYSVSLYSLNMVRQREENNGFIGGSDSEGKGKEAGGGREHIAWEMDLNLCKGRRKASQLGSERSPMDLSILRHLMDAEFWSTQQEAPE